MELFVSEMPSRDALGDGFIANGLGGVGRSKEKALVRLPVRHF
jgi:hypothetical protein